MKTQTLAAEALRLAGDPTPLRDCAPVGGGSISQALRLRSDRGLYLLKYAGRALPGFFAAEARGLTLLRSTGAVRVPAVLAHRDDQAGEVGFILLEWLVAPPEADRQAAAIALGTKLATLVRRHTNALG